MLFNSWEFILLLVITFCIYYIPIFARFQVIILILSSCIFYSYHSPSLLLLLLLSASITHYCTFRIEASSTGKKRHWAVVGVVSNLSILIVFKYAGLVGSFLPPSTSELNDFLISIPLPIGISFYTFQGISLLADTFKSRGGASSKSRVSFINNFFYIVFFPQLIAGPIVKSRDFKPQIRHYKIKEINFTFCLKHLITGYFLKMVIADNLKDQTVYFSDVIMISTLSTITSIVLLIGYSVQIFSDFAGYSYIALGLARLFGYRIIKNFNFPYIAIGFSNFWKRWNISLSLFLKEYLYIPLGGSKRGKWRMYINLLITMSLGGLWHGASFGYLIWGVYHGILLCLEKLISSWLNIKIPDSILILATYLFVTIGWILFIFTDYSELNNFINVYVNNVDKPIHYAVVVYTLLYCIPVVLVHFYQYYKERFHLTPNKSITTFIYALMLFLIIMNSGTAGSFIYFQF